MKMSLLRFYDYVIFLTTDNSLHQWLAQFAGHRYPIKKQKNWFKLVAKRIDESFTILNSNDWTKERTSGNDVISSQYFQSIGKVFKYEGIINCNVEKLKERVFHEIDQTPEWNSTLQTVKVIENIDQLTCITRTITRRYHILSPREFVHLRACAKVDNSYILTCISVSHPKVPENNDIIRAEHRIFSYIMVPVPGDSSKTHFIWLMNANLKGWFPQQILDQALSSAMMDHMDKFQSSIK